MSQVVFGGKFFVKKDIYYEQTNQPPNLHSCLTKELGLSKAKLRC